MLSSARRKKIEETIDGLEWSCSLKELAKIAKASLCTVKKVIEERRKFRFSSERSAEKWLIENWKNSILADLRLVTNQFTTDTGPLDILALDDDDNLVVIELKNTDCPDAAVGQVLRYMAFVRENVAEPGQRVLGMLVAPTASPTLLRTLRLATFDVSYRELTKSFVRGLEAKVPPLASVSPDEEFNVTVIDGTRQVIAAEPPDGEWRMKTLSSEHIQQINDEDHMIECIGIMCEAALSS